MNFLKQIEQSKRDRDRHKEERIKTRSMEEIAAETLKRKEEAAMAIANDKERLRKRLEGARQSLPDKLAKLTWKFDFLRKRLVHRNFSLQWSLRNNPSEPESYENQQTTVGIVTFFVADKQIDFPGSGQ